MVEPGYPCYTQLAQSGMFTYDVGAHGPPTGGPLTVKEPGAESSQYSPLASLPPPVWEPHHSESVL